MSHPTVVGEPSLRESSTSDGVLTAVYYPTPVWKLQIRDPTLSFHWDPLLVNVEVPTRHIKIIESLPPPTFQIPPTPPHVSVPLSP
eukprot:749162-Hanusia_phi.AAC.1